MNIEITSFFDKVTSTFSYIVADVATKRAAIIDPVLDYEPHSGLVATTLADEMLTFAKTRSYKIERLLETHVHADHLSAAAYLKSQTNGRLGIGAGVTQIQKTFKQVYNLGDDFVADGSPFDDLFDDGEIFSLGNSSVKIMHAPGHTNDSVSYLIEDIAFVGDTIFMPDVGTARCDFPGGEAGLLYDSIQKFYALPASTRLYMCHDYPPAGRPVINQTTVTEERENNVHIKKSTTREDFVSMRQERDAGLGMPRLILPALQVNIRAGELPPPDSNGVIYLKIPINFDFNALKHENAKAA